MLHPEYPAGMDEAQPDQQPAAPSANVVELTAKGHDKARPFGGMTPEEASAKARERRREMQLTRKQQTEAQKRLEADLRKQVGEMSKIQLYHKYLSELQDDTPVEEWAEAAIRKLIGGILCGDIEVKGSNAAPILDSLFKIVQLTQGKPTAIDGDALTREERKETLKALQALVAERKTGTA